MLLQLIAGAFCARLRCLIQVATESWSPIAFKPSSSLSTAAILAMNSSATVPSRPPSGAKRVLTHID